MPDDIQRSKPDSLTSVHRFIETGATRRIRWLPKARRSSELDSGSGNRVTPDVNGVYQINAHPQWRPRAEGLRHLIARHSAKI